jgi:hypothetical protein
MLNKRNITIIIFVVIAIVYLVASYFLYKAQNNISENGRQVEMTNQAVISTEQAQHLTLTPQAEIATSQALTATLQMQLFTDISGTATPQAQIATNQAGTSTPQAQIATSQAGTATEQSIIATAQILTATAQVATATAQADIEFGAIRRLIDQVDIPITYPSTEESILISEVKRVDSNYGIWQRCSLTDQSITTNFSDFVDIDANSSYLWAGSLIQGESLQTGVLNGIPLDRAPGTITLSIGGSEMVNEPNSDNIRQAIEHLLPETPTDPQADIDYKVKLVQSYEQAMLEAGIAASFTPPGWKASLGIENKSDKSYVVIQFRQNYFTVDFANPQDSVSLLANPSVSQAKNYIYGGNPPAYISSVTYGRMFVMVASSSSVGSALKAAIEFSFFKNPDTGIYAKADLEKIAKEATINLVFIGGSSERAMGIITDGKFQEYLSDVKFSKASYGKPISYRVNYLKNNQAASISYATNFQGLAECDSNYLPPTTFQVKLDAITVYTVGRATIFGKVFDTADMSFDFNVEHSELLPVYSSDKMRVRNNTIYPFNYNSVTFDMPSKNKSCFTIHGTFTRIVLPEFNKNGSLDDRICFQDGNWQGAIGSTSKIVIMGPMQIEVFYTVEKFGQEKLDSYYY